MTRKEALEIVKKAAYCWVYDDGANFGEYDDAKRPEDDEIMDAVRVLAQDPPTPSVWNKGDYEAYQGRDMHVGMSPLARFGCDAYEDGYEEGKRAQAPTPSGDMLAEQFQNGYRAGQYAEREENAQIASDQVTPRSLKYPRERQIGYDDAKRDIAHAIRSRTPKPKEQE